MEDYKKKYEGLKKKAETLHKMASETSHENTRMAIEELFPELKESEDERIRKAIKLLVKMKEKDSIGLEPVYGASYKEMIAWLEKQSTPQVRTDIEWVNIIDDACEHRYVEEYAHGEYCHQQSFRWGFQEGVDWLEKQGEQKPIMNVPSREVILSIWDLGNEWRELTNGCISTEYGTQLEYIQKHWQDKALKERMKGE